MIWAREVDDGDPITVQRFNTGEGKQGIKR